MLIMSNAVVCVLTLYAAIFWGISSIFLAMSANLRMSATLLELGGRQLTTCKRLTHHGANIDPSSPGCLLLCVLVALLALVLAEGPVVLLLLLWVWPVPNPHHLAGFNIAIDLAQIDHAEILTVQVYSVQVSS